MNELLLQNSISEDTVHTLIFSSFPNSDPNFWANLCKEINSTVDNISNGYIWHRDRYKVCLPIFNDDNNCAMPMHLMATTCFGDNIEDEWFIVYLILELSKKYPDLIIHITDNDGDFLLIEAADHLPSWAKPENTENRVFIWNNAIHLISPELASLQTNLKLIDALQIITKSSQQTVALPEIQKAILSRIGSYPEKVRENIHQGILYLPVDIATILTLQPSLIAPIVTTYCNHDEIDLQACRNIEFLNYVYTEVKFSKCLYAMLVHSKLIRSRSNKITAQDKRKELGLKITYGYQMLMRTLVTDIYTTKEFNKFKINLKQNGYFREYIEGSKEYNNLLENAKKYFIDIECPVSTYISNNVSQIMASDEFLKCKEFLKAQNITDKGLIEDSDDWLNIEPSQLNHMLNNRYGKNINLQDEDLVTADRVTSKLTDFLKQTSDFEGVEIKNKDYSDDESINFDANQFADCVEKMMNLLSGNDHSSSEEDSESENEEFENDQDQELASKLNSYEVNRNDKNNVLFNLTQSIKEEGLSGPSSNLLSSIGIHKTDLLDSDDD